MIILFFSFYGFINLCFGVELKNNLSDVLFHEYLKRISTTEEGRKIANLVRNDKVKIYFKYADDKWLAWYESFGNIFFNLKYVMLFFSIEDYDKERIEKVMLNSKRVREEFIKYTDFIFIHEIVHYLQDKKYEDLRNYIYEFVEFEYEAYILSDIYFYERMKKERTLFLDILSGKYYDIYTSYAMGGFISSIDFFENYLNTIKQRYLEEIKGYVSLNEENTKRKIVLEEKKIISYATGRRDIYEKNRKVYEKFDKIVKDYFKNIYNSLKKKWEKYVAQALPFICDSALEGGNYQVFWRGCYFMKKLSNKDCFKNKNIEEVFNSFFENFKKRQNMYSALIEEVYWYKKFVYENKVGDFKLFEDDWIKKVIIECDNKKDERCLKMIDEIYNFQDF
ncbi:MAG: hypothetical protein N2446_00355 [Elusimicrobiales bacterium]|nr:hypothetical protein [Elusimicrobiales bacterium]